MLKEERQAIILQILKENGKVVATELSARLQVSEDTIRRDLADLSKQGRMQRVHGGALPHSPAAVSYSERLSQSPQSKAAIAQAVIDLIHDGQTVFLDGGTTTLQVARLLPAGLRVCVVTNSPLAAAELAHAENANVILIGGKLNKPEQVITGAAAVDAIRAIHADLCILGICSLDPSAGITVVDYEEARVKQAMVESSDRVVALASSEKLGTVSPFRVAPLMELDQLITDAPADCSDLRAFEEMGIQVTLVDASMS